MLKKTVVKMVLNRDYPPIVLQELMLVRDCDLDTLLNTMVKNIEEDKNLDYYYQLEVERVSKIYDIINAQDITYSMAETLVDVAKEYGVL